MGYAHRYATDKILDPGKFLKVVNDFKKLTVPLTHLGVKLAGPMGEGEPVLESDYIAFNGLENCGHKKRIIGLVTPAPGAKGIASSKADKEIGDGRTFVGIKTNTRICNGDCSYETFSLEQNDTHEYSEEWDGKLIPNATKTNYKPYDLAVTCCLVIAKHHLKEQIEITSDGKPEFWEDARMVCQHFLGYGENIKFDQNFKLQEREE